MKRISLLLLVCLLSACSAFQLDVVKDRNVIITEPPNAFFEPFTCGDKSIDVTHTTKTCNGQKPCKCSKPMNKGDK